MNTQKYELENEFREQSKADGLGGVYACKNPIGEFNFSIANRSIRPTGQDLFFYEAGKYLKKFRVDAELIAVYASIGESLTFPDAQDAMRFYIDLFHLSQPTVDADIKRIGEALTIHSKKQTIPGFEGSDYNRIAAYYLLDTALVNSDLERFAKHRLDLKSQNTIKDLPNLHESADENENLPADYAERLAKITKSDGGKSSLIAGINTEKNPLPEIVQVWWLDSCVGPESWVRIDEFNPEIAEIHTIGYVVKSNARSMTIAASVSLYTDGSIQAQGLITIARCQIQKMCPITATCKLE